MYVFIYIKAMYNALTYLCTYLRVIYLFAPHVLTYSAVL
jgi:hypothetical protein